MWRFAYTLPVSVVDWEQMLGERHLTMFAVLAAGSDFVHVATAWEHSGSQDILSLERVLKPPGQASRRTKR
jgi:hypothetical protein